MVQETQVRTHLSLMTSWSGWVQAHNHLVSVKKHTVWLKIPVLFTRLSDGGADPTPPVEYLFSVAEPSTEPPSETTQQTTTQHTAPTPPGQMGTSPRLLTVKIYSAYREDEREETL